MKKILIAGILGGIVAFLWSSVAHMVLPTGTMGIQSLPNEEAVTTAMKQAIPEPGFYYFPGMDMSRQLTPEEEKAWAAKYAAGPVGILVYHPVGGTPMSARMLLVELLSDVLAGLVLAWVLSLAALSIGKRAAAGALLGLFAWLSLSVSMWNWFGFPDAYLVSEGLDQVIGWLLAALVMGLLLRPKPVAT
jgi:hypothetical protein